jgi:hypothetical protein
MNQSLALFCYTPPGLVCLCYVPKTLANQINFIDVDTNVTEMLAEPSCLLY